MDNTATTLNQTNTKEGPEANNGASDDRLANNGKQDKGTGKAPPTTQNKGTYWETRKGAREKEPVKKQCTITNHI